jgi:hypothetical protein
MVREDLRMIRVECPRCGHGFAVEDDLGGRSDRCPNCATAVRVPRSAAETPSEGAAAIHVTVPLEECDGELQAAFDCYLAALAAAVPALKLFPATGPGAELIIPVTLKPGGNPEFTAIVEPAEEMLDPPSLARLFAALFAVEPPATRGPAAATITFAIRGGCRG